MPASKNALSDSLSASFLPTQAKYFFEPNVGITTSNASGRWRVLQAAQAKN